MTPGSKEKPLRLSTAWQLTDLWGLRKGREMSLFPPCIKISGGNKEFRLPEYLPFLSLSFPLSLLFLFPFLLGGHHAVLCYVLLIYMRMHLGTFDMCCIVKEQWQPRFKSFL